jgi:deoxyadenosine/deoxycytidine kinase
MPAHNFIVIEGNIGAGKTSLATMYAKHLSARLILEEFTENTFLPKFYENPERYAFPVELSFLSERFSQLKKELITPDLFSPLVVADYFISKCQIFARNNLQKDEYDLFLKMYEIVEAGIPRPDLLVYLYLPVYQLQENIRKRGRSYEQQISDDYLANIQKQYLEFIRQHGELRVLIVDTSEVDFVNDAAHTERVFGLLSQEWPKGVNRVKA